FKDRMVEAFDLFKVTLSLIKETVRPIFEFFGSDVTSGLLPEVADGGEGDLCLLHDNVEPARLEDVAAALE
ncbi:hypothetical protein, partial [Rhizobium leguminosarum]|uniref:hypothetical protein n=1 Tax=Rhizobium leguminosarum TaxID=384 RepID=UPI003F99CC45